ncbi:hypothetical protein BC830DRAFT_1217950 [Chytriomyces sp. MP71]|nr:hypothetical protein BC830DRAFT_1217950 [Chytriomyces sp. MP71]
MAVDWTLVFPIIVGASITFQGAASALMGKNGGTFYSTFAVFGTGLIPAIIHWLAATNGGTSVDYHTGFSTAAWYSYLGGFCGPSFVMSIIFLAPKIGAGTFFVTSVSAQLTSALVFQNWGWISLPQHTASSGAIAGLCVILLSVAIIGSAKPATPAVEAEGEHSVTVIGEEKIVDGSSDKAMEEGVEVVFKPSINILQYTLYLVIAAGAGISGSLQAGMNSSLGVAFNSPPFCIFVVSLVTLVPVVPAYIVEYRKTPTDFRKVWLETPWWCWTTGIISYMVVAMFSYLPTHLDSAVLQACLVTSQVILAIVADHFGWWGLNVNRITLQKAVGTVMLVAGVVVMSVFQ